MLRDCHYIARIARNNAAEINAQQSLLNSRFVCEQKDK